MHLSLIYLSVIMLLGYATGSKVQDLSGLCAEGQIHDSYLTFGVGYSDNLVSMLATTAGFDCILNFAVKAKNYIMLVLEFPDLKPKARVCVSQENSNNSVTVSDYNEKKNCQYTGSETTYRSLSLEKATVQLTSLHDLGAIKITVTSMRGLKHFECSGANETQCIFAGNIYCMTKSIVCDGHSNCGIPDLYDEDIALCKGQHLNFLVIMLSLLMGALTVFLFGSICLTLLPKRKETFVYRANEAITIFDTESEIVSAEIDIKVLFSEHINNLNKQKNS